MKYWKGRLNKLKIKQFSFKKIIYSEKLTRQDYSFTMDSYNGVLIKELQFIQRLERKN